MNTQNNQPAPTEFDWDNFRKELGEELGYVTSLFMSQEKKGTEIVMPTEELRETIDRILLYLHPLKSRTVPLAEYQALEKKANDEMDEASDNFMKIVEERDDFKSKLVTAQEKLEKVKGWVVGWKYQYNEDKAICDLNQILDK